MKRRDFVAKLPIAALGLSGLLPIPALANTMDFDAWLAALRAEARQRGFSERTVNDALTGLTPIPRVLELDRRQPETTLTFDQYVQRVVNDARAETARQRIVENRDILEGVSRRFNVQPRFIVALWAIETDFGRITGGFPIVQALATLAHDGRRSAFFREELFNALRIIERTGISARDMKGSWAGAMGQSQFMPSSYLAYAVDHDGDGRADIWNSRPDVFASIANYLSKVGWRNSETWGRQVRLPAGFDPALVDDRQLKKAAKTLAEWHALGVRKVDGSPLPHRDVSGWIVQPGGGEGPSFLVYGNYKALLHWNRSLFFATAVGYLADRIGDG
jgi:membrane-bound lytic murein transglycosylase B